MGTNVSTRVVSELFRIPNTTFQKHVETVRQQQKLPNNTNVNKSKKRCGHPTAFSDVERRDFCDIKGLEQEGVGVRLVGKHSSLQKSEV